MTVSDAEKPDSLDALLRQAAHVSATVAGSGRTLSVGTTLAGGRLSILRKLGEGGMGTVYEAFDNQRRGRVALKTLTRVDAAGVYRLKNEFRALSDVTHPNLVQLYELFAEGDAWFFTMELIDGERFDRWLRSEDTCDLARVRDALPQILHGVTAIHAAGKLHRDLKPSNVLVTAEGRLVILDFGLAVDPELGGIGHTVAEQSVSGTPAYMAPEQAAGERATTASDHYAVGVMLFEALAGRLPFEGRAGAMLAAKQRDVAPDPRSLDASVPDNLAELCVALLARDPAARPDGVALRGTTGVGDPAARDQPSPWRVSAPAPALPELLGRASELAALRAAYAASLTGQAVVLFVTGESGMGKSALLDAFLAELRETGQTVVLAGRCYERENVPYKGFDALVDELSRVLRKLPLHEAAALLPREVFALARIFPVLERLQVVAEAPRREVPDPQDLKHRAFEAFGELLARMRDRGPVTIVIDDLQWIDQDSVRFMRALLTHSTPAPILLVCAQRSEGAEANELLSSVRSAAAQNPALSVRELAVAALPHAALVALAERLLPDSMDPRVTEDLARAAQGSPFFAAELARAAPLRAPHEPPLALSDALALHVRSLAPEAQRLLAVLAIAGQPLSPLRAIEAAELSDGHVHLDRLRSEQLVRFSFDAEGERRVECYHDKIREQVSGQLDLTRTRWLAASLANALRAAGGGDSELLTRLLELADQLALAGEYAAQAAERAAASLAFTRAAALFELALRNGQFPEERMQALRVAHAEALASAGQGERAGAAFVAAAQGTRGDEARDLTRKAGEQYLMCGDLEHGQALMAQVSRQVGLSFARSLGGALISLVWWRLRLHFSRLRFVPRAQLDPESERELALLNTLTTGLVRTDQLRGADFCARWVLRALKAGHAVELARALAWEFLFTSMMDLSQTRLKLVEKLCEQLIAQTSDPIAAQTFSYTRGIYLLLKRGDCDAALAELDRSLALVNKNPGPTTSYARPWVQYFRASALGGMGKFEEATTIAQAMQEDALARGDRSISSVLTGSVMWGFLAADRPDLARELLERQRLSLRPGEETLQDLYWLVIQPMADAYTGHYREAWYAAEAHRDRYLSSFTGRILNPGAVEMMACSVAVAAARHTDEPRERRRLMQVAERLEKSARRATYVGFPAPLAALLCMRGDREGAIACLRRQLSSKSWPFVATVVRYRLGELLQNDEGRALIAEADQALRAGGVVNPARFVASFMPGVELP